MKKFIFGVMLLVSVWIVGCSMNPSDSDGSENVTYTVKNSTGSEMSISYKNKSGEWTNEQTILVNGTYEIPANDAVVDYGSGEASVVYFKVNGIELLPTGTVILENDAQVTLNGNQPQIVSFQLNK